MKVCRTVPLLPFFWLALAAQSAHPPCGGPGSGSSGTIAARPRHCSLTLLSDETAEVTFNGRDRDLKLELLDQAGHTLAAYDMRETGPEFVVVMAPAGSYLLRLSPLEKRNRATSYTVRVRHRPAQAQDEARSIAQAAATQARKHSLTDARASQESAREAFQDAARLWRQIGDREAEAAALTGAGTAMHHLGQHEQAAATFTQALELVEGIDTDWLEAECLNNLGIALWQGGQFRAAIERYLQALIKLRQAGHHRGQIATLSNLGIVHRAMGEYDRARQYHAQALPISIKVGEPAAEAYVRNNLGVVLSFLGQRTAAIASLTRARQLFHGLAGSIRAEGRALMHLASIEFAARRYRAASAYIQPALDLIQQSGDQRSLADTILLQARLLAVRGQMPDALAALRRAEKICRAAHLSGGEASVLHALGELASQDSQYESAASYFENALRIRRSLAVRDAIAETLYRLAAVRRATGNLQEARNGAREALQLTEEIRTLISGPEYRMSYLSSRHDYYDLAIQIDVDLHLLHPHKGYDRSAFELSERARSRSLLDTLNANYQNPAVQTLRARLRELTSSLHVWSYRLSEQAAAGASAERLAATRVQVDELLAEYRGLQSDVASRNGQPGNSHGPLTPAQIQESLTGQMSLLQYFVGEERSVGWLVTRHSNRMAVLPGRTSIEKLSHRFYGSVLQPASSVPVVEQTARALARAILPAPLRPPLGELLIAPDGVLHQIPITLLPDENGTPLLLRHGAAIVPSVSSVIAQRAVRPLKAQTDGTLAVVADPVFHPSDPRVRTLVPAASKPSQYPRLGYAGREAARVAAMIPEAKRVLKTGFEAAPALFLNGEITRYRNLHIATHAGIDEFYPEFSSLVFSLVDQSGRPANGYLRASDIAALSIRADLVTLSACGTGLGTRIRGEGPLSLARAFLTAGARTVLVSLWSVPDDATSELMTAFYQKLLGTPAMSPASAFRQAQMEIRLKPGRQHPFYWAGWVLTGDWQ